MTRTLRPYQRDLIDAVERDWAAGERSVAVELPTGGGKGHPLATLVPTPRGMRLWGELVVGDQVYGSDGRPTTVTGVFDRGVLPTYRVTFSDGAAVDVDGDHLWRVRVAEFRRTSREWATVTTEALAASDLKPGRGYRFHVPMTGPVSGMHTILPLDPYVVGALIANGGMTTGGTILTTPDTAVAERVGRHVEIRRVNDTTNVCTRYSLPGLTPVTRALGLRARSAAKRIPAAYLEALASQRLALLQGLMDGDGSARDSGRRSVLYHTTSPVLAAQVSELVTSLGGTGVVHRTDRGVKGVEFDVRILLPSGLSPFGTNRKGFAGAETVRNMQPKRAVVAIDRIDDQAIRCISVAAPDSLYLITDQHIVTHNTFTFANVLQRQREAGHPRALVVAHREELVDQAVSDLLGVFGPGSRVGRVQGAHKPTAGVDAAVGMIQTLATDGGIEAAKAGMFSSVIVDECHHSASPTYRRLLDALPHARVLGVSATLARSDRLALGEVFSKISYVKPIVEMIREGWLVRPRGRHVFVEGLDLSRVRRRGGDFADGALAAAMKDSLAPDAILRAWQEHAKGRPTIGFAPSVEMAYLLAETFRTAGVRSRAVHGDQSAQGRAERRSAVASYRAGEIEVLWNVGVLTEGFDAPETSCVIMARPTTSRVLFTQCVGRGLRLAPGKDDCLILDVVGVLGRHKLASLASLDGAASEEDTPDELLAYEDEWGEAREEELDFGGPSSPFRPEFVDGRLDWTEIELFEESAFAWLRTAGGTPFIINDSNPGDPFVVFPVMRVTGGVALAMAPVNRVGGELSEMIYADIPEAMLAVERWLALEGNYVRRGAGWRNRTDVSQAQIGQAARWGVAVSPGMTKGDVSDAISIAQASQRIDHLPLVTEGL